MVDSVEKFGQIHVDTVSESRADMKLDLLDSSVCRAFWSETEARLGETRIEDRCQDLEDCLLDQSIGEIGNAEISERAINAKEESLQYGFTPSGAWLVSTIE